MALRIGDSSLPLSHVGPDSVILKSATDIPRGVEAEVMVWVGGRLVKRPVWLTYGAVPSDEIVEASGRRVP